MRVLEFMNSVRLREYVEHAKEIEPGNIKHEYYLEMAKQAENQNKIICLWDDGTCTLTDVNEIP